MMKNKWRMPHPATMFLLLTMAVVFLSWICDIYGLKVTLPQTGEDIRVQSLLSPEGIRWWLRNAIKNFTGFAPLGMVIIAMFGLGVAQHSGFIDACIRMGIYHFIAYCCYAVSMGGASSDCRDCYGLCFRCVRV